MKHVITLLWVLLVAVPGRSLAQTYQCEFDSLWQQESLADSMLHFKHLAHIEQVNRFRNNTVWNYDVIPYGVLPQGLGSGPNCRNAIFVIPVAVHVVHDPGNPASNIRDSLVEKQLEILNAAYAPYQIQFCLAQADPYGASINGISRIPDNSPIYESPGPQKDHLAGLVYYDRERYLNIWVVNDIWKNGQSVNKKGYSNIKYMSGVDGIVMRYEWFGDYTDCSTCGFHSDSRGKSLVHEVGHYLGLFHTFEGGCGAGPDSNSCGTAGDFCCDTRPTLMNFNCPVPSTNACPSLPFYGSQTDNYANYMAYADEPCFTNFTPDQVSVMYAQLSGPRKNLISTSNVNSLGLSCCLTASWFNINNGFLCQPGPIDFLAIEHDSVDYRWQVYNDTVQVLDTTLATAGFSWTLSRHGKYHVKLSVITNSDSIVLERKDLIELKDCGPVMASTQGNWYFGRYAGLQFRAVGPVLDLTAFKSGPRTVNSFDGGISHSDGNGNLLFYAGGDSTGQGVLRLYRPDTLLLNNHIEVNKDTTLFGHNSSSQTGIVIPFKHDSTRFHLFVVNAEEIEAACYHNVLDIDTPDLVMPNHRNMPIPVPAGSATTGFNTLAAHELITTVPACDGNHWLIVADGSIGYANEKQLLVYLVTDSTIVYVTKSDDRIPDYFGQLKASPDGTKLAAPGVIFNFDRATGAITTFKKVPTDGIGYFGTSFSPDSRLVYFASQKAATPSIYQYDLESNDSLLSRQLVPGTNTHYVYALQLGPDGNIYGGTFMDELAVISNPDSIINPLHPNACGFDMHGPSLKDADGNGGHSMQGLPNMMDARYIEDVPLDFSILDTACGSVMFSPNDACAGTYLWHFGDGDSSVLKDPFHNYADTGTYTVTLTINGFTQKTRTLKIGTDRPIIAGDSIVSCNLSDITIYTIENLNREFEYTWNITGGEIVDIEEFENAWVRWDSAGSISVSVRNKKNNCTASDTFSITVGYVRDNTIELDLGACFEGDSFFLSGSFPTVSFPDSSMHFQWEKQTLPNDSWKTLTDDTLQNYAGVTLESTVWYRRIAYNSACESYSNVIEIRPKIRVVQDLLNVANCTQSKEAREFPIVLDLDSGVSVLLEFYHYKDMGSGRVWTTGDTASYPHAFSADPYSGDSAKIKVMAEGCSEFYTNTAVVRNVEFITSMPHSTPTCQNISIVPIPVTAGGGIQPAFTVILDSSHQWLLETSNCDDFFLWEGVGANDGNDTLFLDPTYCYQGNYQVALIGRNPGYPDDCRFAPSCNFDARIAFSNGLWSKDGAADTAAEPNTDPTRDYWQSPDLWNCWQTIFCSVHENPEFMNGQAWNYVRNKIRNDGAYPSDSFNVHLYWTLGGFYERWPIGWHFDTTVNGFYNPNWGQTFPMGGEIGVVGISSLGSGQTQTITYEWDPPYPGWYDTSSFYKSERVAHPLCLLSRIVTCDEGPYGMTIEEIEPTGKNVINNSRIVTRNTEVYDSIATNKKSPVYVLRMGNQVDQPQTVRLKLDNLISNYWDLGYITLKLAPNIHTAWVAGGSVGGGYSLGAGNVFKIAVDSFYLDNIILDGYEWGWAYFQFKFHTTTTLTTDRGQQLFQFVQYSSLDTVSPVYSPDGGFNFLLNLLPPFEEEMFIRKDEPKDQDAGQGSTLVWSQEIAPVPPTEAKGTQPETGVTRTTVMAYPNPSVGLVYFEMSLETERTVGIELYSTLGVKVRQIPTRSYGKGTYTLDLNGSTLAPGAYFAKVNINGEVKVVSIVIAR